MMIPRLSAYGWPARLAVSGVQHVSPTMPQSRQKSSVNLVVRSEAILGRKSTRKLISKINVRLLVHSQIFLLGKTAGFCTDAPAGPCWISSL
jgi:hypothetical protein